MNKYEKNQSFTMPIAFCLSIALALTAGGCGKSKSKGHPPVTPTPAPQPTPQPSPQPSPGPIRSIKDPEPSLALAPRWVDFNFLPPSFKAAQHDVVPIDIETIDSKLTFDVLSKSTQGQTTLSFVSYEDGFPMFDLTGVVSALALDGVDLTTADLVETNLPDGQSSVRVLQKELRKGEKHSLTLTYVLPEGSAKYSEQGVSFGLFMSDLRGSTQKYYLERYLPANFEYDQFSLHLQISVLNSAVPLQLFTNGTRKSDETNHWDITFPDYFTASSPYLHLTEKPMVMKNDSYVGIEKTFPILVYGETETKVNDALVAARATLHELEADFGAYPHDKLVIYLSDAMGGGMEYSGATVTSLWALSHELTHSWFARSVMPADGNSGWIDEAIASWRDSHYPRYRADVIYSRLPELAAGTDYQRFTNFAAYTSGVDLLSSIDNVLERKGRTRLKTVLSKLYKEHKNQIITTRFFKSFIEGETQLDFGDYFEAYAFEKNPGVAPAVSRLRKASPYHAPSLNERQLRDIL